MNSVEYYQKIYRSLRQSFERSELVLAYGRELIPQMGFGPYDLLVTVQRIEEMRKLAVEWGLEVFVPIRARDAVMFPFDFEVSLSDENSRLYTSADSQRHYVLKYIIPVARHLERFFQERRIPYMLDFTPSGGHFLFYALRGTKGWYAAQEIGSVDDDLKTAYRWTDATGADLKRQYPVSEEEARVYSGLGRLAEYIGLTVIRDAADIFHREGGHDLEVHLCDAAEKSVNLDISWAADPIYQRFMRAPGSLHKKNMNKHDIAHHGPLADIKATYYDGHVPRQGIEDPEDMIAGMWNLERAAEINLRTPGHVPYANEGLARLVGEYKRSGLWARHRSFDAEEEMPRGAARLRAMADARLHEKTRSAAAFPNPRMLQPEALRKMTSDFLEKGWTPRQVAAVIRDCYNDPSCGWTLNWLKIPAETRSRFWARIYASMHLLESGERLV